MKNVLIAGAVLIVVGTLVYFYIPTKNSTSLATTPTSVATVSIKNYSFDPPILTVKAGTKVTWINDDSAQHTVTSDSGNSINSANIASGKSSSFTFTQTGTIKYHCNIHPEMQGSIVVTN